jgi:hypothetical protein
MKFFTNRKENVKPEVQSVQEETISERQTTKIGYVMLFLMIVFVVGIAQTIFFDLGQLVGAPDRPDTYNSEGRNSEGRNSEGRAFGK